MARRMGGSGVHSLRNDGESRVELREGVVTTAPADALAAVGVAYATRPDHEVVVTRRWSPRGTHLPQVDDPCTIADGPNSDPVVVAWERA